MKKLLKTLALVLALALAVTCVFAGCGDKEDGGKKGGDNKASSYKDIIDVLEEYANAKEYYDEFDQRVALYGGFCEDEMEDFAKVYKKSIYVDEESSKEYFEEAIAENKAEYGDDYKYTYKIVDELKFTDEDIADYADDLKDSAEEFEYTVAEYEDGELEDIADEMGFEDINDASDYLEIMKAVAEKYGKAKLTDGYYVTVEITITGSLLEEPIVETDDYEIVKVDGFWVLGDLLF